MRLFSLISFVFIFLHAGLSFCQDVDSLLKKLSIAKQPAERSILLHQIIQVCDPVEIPAYANELIAICEKGSNKSTDSLLAAGYFNLAFYHDYVGEFKQAIENCNKSAKIYKSIKATYYLAQVYNQLGNTYDKMGNIQAAISSYQQAFNINKAIKQYCGQAVNLVNIGYLYTEQKEGTKAIEQYKKAETLAQTNQCWDILASVYENMGTEYFNSHDTLKAKVYNLKAIEIKEKYHLEQSLDLSYYNLAIYYKKVKNLPLFLENINKALSYADKFQNVYGQVNCYQSLCDYYFQLKDYSNAIKNGEKAYQLAIGVGAPDLAVTVGKILKEVYFKTGQFQKAFQIQEWYVKMKDSISNENNKKNAIRSQFQMEFKEKEDAVKEEQLRKEIKHKEESKRQRIIIFSSLVVIFLIAVFAYFIYSRLKLIRAQKLIIEKQKETVEVQKVLVEEKNKEITDSIHYAQRIQQAIFTSPPYIKTELSKVNSDFFIYFQPKDIVSGDFYWALSIPPIPGWDMHTTKRKGAGNIERREVFYLCTGDCTGHGIPGSFMSLLNIAYLNENVIEKGIRLPHDVLNQQRSDIIKALNPTGTENARDGMDCVLYAIDFDKMVVHIAAANNPIWIIRNKEVIEIKADKMPVGLYDNNAGKFNLTTFELEKEDVLYTFTDGYADQFGGPAGKKFKYKPLKELLISISHLPMSEQEKKVRHIFESWVEGYAQIDDVLLIGVKIG